MVYLRVDLRARTWRTWGIRSPVGSLVSVGVNQLVGIGVCGVGLVCGELGWALVCAGLVWVCAGWRLYVCDGVEEGVAVSWG